MHSRNYATDSQIITNQDLNSRRKLYQYLNDLNKIGSAQ